MSKYIYDQKKCSEFGDDYDFIQNSQDIRATIEQTGRDDNWIFRNIHAESIDDIGSLFVLISDGELWEVWGHTQEIPYQSIQYELIWKRSY